jgi:hypothetical protein
VCLKPGLRLELKQKNITGATPMATQRVTILHNSSWHLPNLIQHSEKIISDQSLHLITSKLWV